VKIDDGDATFRQRLTHIPGLDSIVRLSLPPSQKIGTTLHFPAMLSVGAAWRALPGWTWEGDVNWTQWTAFDELKLDFKTTPALNTAIVENYHDSWRISVGAEHQLDSYAYRFGYYYDQDAAPPESVTPLLPDATRHGVTLGLGFQMGAQKSWSVDLYNLALFVEKRGTEGVSRDHYEGVYKAFVNSLGLTVGHHW
jgi:long-chain fatty acid transport protein